MSDTLPTVLDGVFRQVPGVRWQRQAERHLRVELTEAERLPALLALLKGEAGYRHLSAISCVDWPQSSELELVYHLDSHTTHTLLSAHVRIPDQPGRFVSVHEIHTPAGFFERDIHEMFGVQFDGALDLSPFILTEWGGPPPMRKSFDTEQYVQDHYSWLDYSPEWLAELEARGGGIVE